MPDDGLKIRVGADVGDLESGFEAATNSVSNFSKNATGALSVFSDAMRRMGGSSQFLASAFQSLSAVSGPAAFIGIATVALMKFGSKMTEVQKQAKELQAALSKSGGESLFEKSNLQSLLTIAQDLTNSAETRSNAISEINNKYPQFLSNLSTENALSAETSELITKQMKLFDLKAKQEAISVVLRKRFVDLVENENKPIEEQLGLWDKIVIGFKSQISLSGAIADATKRGTDNRKKHNDEIQKTINLLKGEQSSLNKQIAEIGGFKVNTKRLKDDAKKVEKEIAAVLPKYVIQSVQVPITFKKTDGIESVSGYKAFRDKAQKDLEKHPLYIPMQAKLDLFKGFDPNQIPGFASLKANLEAQKQLVQDFVYDINQIVKYGMVDAISSVGETIGSIITDGSKGLSGLSNIGYALAGILENVGKAALMAGLGVKAILQSLEKLDWRIAVGAGIALIALSKVIKSSLSRSAQPTGMATGGIVPPGFDNDTFPARLSSREAVIPLDRLENMIGNNSDTGTLTTRVSGNDLIFILERSRRSQMRSFG